MARISPVRTRRLRSLAVACLLAAAGVACTDPVPRPTASDAEAFLADAEARLLDLWSAHRRAAWVDQRFATEDTADISVGARRERLDGTARLAHAAARFDGVELGAALRRKLLLLRTGPAAIGPAAPELRRELAHLLAGIERAYERAAACTVQGGACLDRPALERLFAESRETDERLDAWLGWRRSAAPGRPAYRRVVELANTGARELGFADDGARWRAAYDLPPDALGEELDRVWNDLRPLYESVHCLVRERLGETYGTAVAPPGEVIPGHLLASPWGGRWNELYDLVRTRERDLWDDLTRSLERRRVDAAAMARLGERFFRSLGLGPLPAPFWERSLLVPPADPGLACRPGAWHIDAGADVRLRMCVEGTGADLVAVHEMLGRAQYLRAQRFQDPVFRVGAVASAIEVAIGGAMGLSMTPGYFVRAGLLERAPAADDVDVLLRRALDTLAYVPFGLAVERWRRGRLLRRGGGRGVQPDLVGAAPRLPGRGARGAAQRGRVRSRGGSRGDSEPAGAARPDGPDSAVPVAPRAVRGGGRHPAPAPLHRFRKPGGGRAAAGVDGARGQPALARSPGGAGGYPFARRGSDARVLRAAGGLARRPERGPPMRLGATRGQVGPGSPGGASRAISARDRRARRVM